MGEKKRKSLTAGSELPKKKTKISLDDYPNLKEVEAKTDSSAALKDASHSEATAISTEPSAAGSKKSRKRAADFLSDDEDEAPEVSSSKAPQTDGGTKAGKAAHEKEKRRKKKVKKAKKDATRGAETLIADVVNGITEKKDSVKVKTTTAKTPAAKSMQAEAQRTADQELEDEWGGFGEDEDEREENKGDNYHLSIGVVPDDDDTTEASGEVEDEEEEAEEEDGAHLLTGFDVDSSDNEDKGYDGNIPGVTKKGRKLLNAVKSKKLDKETGVVYLGRIPHGFYEAEMRGYLGQYGDITRLRLSRNKRSGASKHFAFVEFESKEVARIVAEANNNYMMFGHRLKCSLVEDPSKLHQDTWKGANKKFRRIPHEKLEREQLAAPKSVEAWQKKNQREQKKRDRKAKQLKEKIGYEMPDVKLRDPKEAIEEAKMLEQKSDETVKDIHNGEGEGSEEPIKAIEAAKDSIAEPTIEPKEAEALVNGGAREDITKTVMEAKEPEPPTDGDPKALTDSSSLSKEEKKALKKAKKAKAKAEAAQTKGVAAGTDQQTTTEPKQKQKSTPQADTKPSSHGQSPVGAKVEKRTQLLQQKPEVRHDSEPDGSAVQKDHKKDKKPKGEGKPAERTKKHHEVKSQKLTEPSNDAAVADKKKKTKSAA